ncbi:MAG: DUF1571 domain-containing protein [Pirellulaceae bacterium]|nr:DUF1571 domain-containing protein [Pirellulaceae bacterium]
MSSDSSQSATDPSPPATTASHTTEVAGHKATVAGRQSRRLPKPWRWLLFILAVLAGGWLGYRRWIDRQSASSPPSSESAAAPAPAAVDQRPRHPLDPALEIARQGLESFRRDVRDYTATLTKRERIGGALTEQKLQVKIRQRSGSDPQPEVPMSVYLHFREPPGVAGREVIWVENRNEGKLIAHEGGFKNLLRVNLPPNGMLAMLGNRYPITDIGLENLIVKLIERGEKDKLLGDCRVEFLDEQTADGHPVQVIQVTHPERQPQFDFYQARIHIDQKLNVPIRYSAYLWPETPGGDPVLDEEYVYEDIQLNVGLTDSDFDPDNQQYKFP